MRYWSRPRARKEHGPACPRIAGSSTSGPLARCPLLSCVPTAASATTQPTRWRPPCRWWPATPWTWSPDATSGTSGAAPTQTATFCSSTPPGRGNGDGARWPLAATKPRKPTSGRETLTRWRARSRRRGRPAVDPLNTCSPAAATSGPQSARSRPRPGSRPAGTLYKRFASKEAVLEAVVDRQVSQVNGTRAIVDLLPLGDLDAETVLVFRYLLTEIARYEAITALIEKESASVLQTLAAAPAE